MYCRDRKEILLLKKAFSLKQLNNEVAKDNYNADSKIDYQFVNNHRENPNSFNRDSQAEVNTAEIFIGVPSAPKYRPKMDGATEGGKEGGKFISEMEFVEAEPKLEKWVSFPIRSKKKLANSSPKTRFANGDVEGGGNWAGDIKNVKGILKSNHGPKENIDMTYALPNRRKDDHDLDYRDYNNNCVDNDFYNNRNNEDNRPIISQNKRATLGEMEIGKEKESYYENLRFYEDESDENFRRNNADDVLSRVDRRTDILPTRLDDFDNYFPSNKKYVSIINLTNGGSDFENIEYVERSPLDSIDKNQIFLPNRNQFKSSATHPAAYGSGSPYYDPNPPIMTSPRSSQFAAPVSAPHRSRINDAQRQQHRQHTPYINDVVEGRISFAFQPRCTPGSTVINVTNNRADKYEVEARRYFEPDVIVASRVYKHSAKHRTTSLGATGRNIKYRSAGDFAYMDV